MPNCRQGSSNRNTVVLSRSRSGEQASNCAEHDTWFGRSADPKPSLGMDTPLD